MNELSAPLSLRVRRPTHVRHLVLAALCVVTIINYLQRNSIGPAETTIRADFAVDRTDTGNAVGLFFLGYALMQVPSGWLAQRLGPRLALTIYTAGWSASLAVSALAEHLWQLSACRLALGMLQAGIFPCATLILKVWYPSSQRGFASAMLNSCMLSGGAVCSVLTGQLLGPFGWRLLFALYAVPGLLWAAYFALWFRNRPESHPRVNDAELAIIHGERAAPEAEPKEARSVGGPLPWAAIFLSPALLWLSLQQLCRSASLRFFDVSLPTYLEEAWGKTRAEAGTLASYPLWVAIVSSIVGGVLSDFVLVRSGSRWAGRLGVAVAALVLAIACYCLAYQVASLPLAIAVLSAGSFFATIASPCSYALSMDMGGRATAVIFGVMNMAGNIGSWAFATYIPAVVARSGWERALYVFVALHVAAIVFSLLVNPNGVIGEQTGREKNLSP